MRNFSVKVRITVWLTLLMALLAALLLAFTISISNAVASKSAKSQLSTVVRDNIAQVHMVQNRLDLGEEFDFYRNGVSTLVYSKNESLLAGRLPVSAFEKEAFQNGGMRMVSTQEEQYFVLDIWVPNGWESGVWLRGFIEAPGRFQTTRDLLFVSLVALPVFLALAALGSYRISKRAFRPLNSIIATAEAVNEAKDLSRRIGLPVGKDEFSRLAGTFDQLFERLERSFEAEQQFTADASHELRTPVSIIKGACEYARKYDETPEERQETISMIYRQTLKMYGIISQLLSMMRLDQGTEPLRKEPVNLGQFLNALCVDPAYDQKRLTLDVSEDMTALVYPELLSRLMRNLVENAFKYGKPGGHVWVSAYREKDEILLQVRDDGIGICADQQDKIWQRFYQVDSSRSGEGGVGLGLAMVRQIAKLHGGYMTLSSIPDAGSSFTFHLPAEQDDIN